MQTIADFPYFPVQFNKEGSLIDTSAVGALKTYLASHATDDLLVISHGWNNDLSEARAMYEEFLANARKLLSAEHLPTLSQRKLIVLGVLWPSKKFANDDAIPGGAADVGSLTQTDHLLMRLEELKGGFDDPEADEKLEKLKKLVPALEDRGAARSEFVEVLQTLVKNQPADDHDGDGVERFFSMSARDARNALEQPVMDLPSNENNDSGASGGAAGLHELLGGVVAGMRNALNLTTYYQMKARAGLVGESGVLPVLRNISENHPSLKMHLVGHSFGGRLMSAAASGLSQFDSSKVDSLSLLQAAFSHYGFAQRWDDENDGAFRSVLDKKTVRGVVIATCTTNDKAVGLAYPLASRLAMQAGEALGDENDKFGGIGRNGARKTNEASDGELLAVGMPYAFIKGRVHNLMTKTLIKNHGDVKNEAVVYAVLSAVAASVA